ncbi:hypothetical protein ACKFKG_23025 [Phormidesmis sp. 146-35]
MQTSLGEWLPLVAVAGLAGLFNLIVAYEKFNRKCRSPFFSPWLSLGLWWWVLLQVSLPTLFFWLLFGSSIKPPVTPDLVTKAITFGIAFTPFVNANIDLGFAGVPLGEFYFLLTQPAYSQMASAQAGKLAEFISDLETELNRQATIQLEAGFTYLKNLFRSDFALKYKEVEQQKLLERVKAARIQTSQPQQIDEITSLLLEVRSRDCFSALKRFGCSDTFLQKYFPKKFAKSKAPKP